MKLKTEYEHVHFEKVPEVTVNEPVVWFCGTPDGKWSLGEVQWSKEHSDYVYYQMYEAILTEGQLKDIAEFIKGAPYMEII